MYNATLEGTSSKIEEASLSDLRSWVALVSSSAFDKVDWEKVEALPERKQISFAIPPYKLVVQHFPDPEPNQDDPGLASNGEEGGEMHKDLTVETGTKTEQPSTK